jgi:hypothetical protein
MAQAKDLFTTTGALDPIREPLFITTLGKSGVKKSLYRWPQSGGSETQYWFHWLTDVDVTKGPVKNDTQERVFFTGDGAPKYTDSTLATGSPLLPNSSILLGIPAPSAATVSAGGGSGVTQSVIAAYAYVNSIGEVGPLSPASAPTNAAPGATITVSGMDGAPVGAYNITQKYVYLSQTDANGTTKFRYWQTVPVGTASAAGLIGNLVEESASPSPIAPPSDLFGLLFHPNGFLVGFTKNRFHRSDVFKPYAWPDAFIDPMGDDVVGGAISGNSIVIITNKGVKLSSGSDPQNQYIVEIAGAQAGVAKRTIQVSERGVYYVSNNGICRISPNGAFEFLTEQAFPQRLWKEKNPSGMHAVLQDERYFVWWDNGSDRGLMIFDFRSSSFAMIQSSVYATAAWTDPKTQQVYMALPADNNLYRWDGGANRLVMVATTAEVRLNSAENVGAARVRATGYPITFKLYGDGVLVSTKTVASDRPFFLAGQKRYNRVQGEVSGQFKVTELTIGSCIEDLANV